MTRTVLLSFAALAAAAGDAAAQFRGGFNTNPAGISSSAVVPYRTPATYVYPHLVTPGVIPPPLTAYGGGVLVPYSVYGYGYYGFGGYVDPGYTPIYRGG